MDHQTEIHSLLGRLGEGDGDAWHRLVALVYEQLRLQAHAVFRRERNTLQATALLNEVLAELQLNVQEYEFEGPSRFFALVSRVMRNRLLDHVRRDKTEKRGGGAIRVTLDPSRDEWQEPIRPFEAVDLHNALEELRRLDERLWIVTELKFFYGLNTQQVADSLKLSVSTVESDWRFAKAWLKQKLGDRHDG